MAKYDKEHIVFDNGKRRYANCGIIGISINSDDDDEIYEGYDGTFHSGEHAEGTYYKHRELSREELVELADTMIARWQKFKAKHNG